MSCIFRMIFSPLIVAGILSFLGTATTVAQEERPARAVWKTWQRDISQFDAELRQVVRQTKMPEEASLRNRLDEKSGGLEVVTDGYGGVVDFDAAKGTVQYVANERFGGMNIEWEFELAKDTKVNWEKSTKLIPKIVGAAKGEGQESKYPMFAIAIEKPNAAGPFQAGDRVRLKASIDDFSRFRTDFSRVMGLVAIHYLEEGPNPVFLLKLDEAEITLVEGEEKVGQVNRQPYMDELPDEVSALAGLWRIDPDIDRLLGTAENNRHPNALRLSFAVPGAPVLPKETISLIEDLFVTRMKHTIIAVGEWEADKESELASDRDLKCFVTTKHGATYLWFGTPDKSLFGSEVNHVWVSTRKELLILDGNSMLPPRMRKPENTRTYLPADWKDDIDRP